MKYQDLHSKFMVLSRQEDQVAAFEELQRQKTQLEALLAAAVVRLERNCNASYEANRCKDQVRPFARLVG
jgi:hypothetical protein